MSEMESKKLAKECLRIALNREGTKAYFELAEKLRAENEFVRFQPSDLVSFLVCEFTSSYLTQALPVLVFKFFKSDLYLEGVRREARNRPDFEELMEEAIAYVKRMKSKAGRKRSWASNKGLQSKPEADEAL